MSVTIKTFHHRLGNQLFCIAAGASLAYDHQINFVQPEWGYDKCFRLEYQKYKENNPQPIFNWTEVGFHHTPIRYFGPMTISGYFQSEKYFKHNDDYIRKLFQRRVNPDNRVSSFLLNRNHDDKCTAIHVRRGDYLTLPHHHPVLGMNYYNEAMKILDSSHYFVFSDDIPWCKENFRGENITFIEGNSDIVDFHSMTLCDNVIIGNSSFSWWAAWLNDAPNKEVIAPNAKTKWFGEALSYYNMSDLIPEGWVQI